jgi:hypothetical protein
LHPRVSPENNADEEEDTDRGKALQRNEERLRRLNQGEVLGEYLPEAVGSVFDTAVQGPLDAAVKADGSPLRAIECALRKETPVPRKPPFQFDMTPKAREHNTKILEECDYDLEKVIQQNTGSTISHGSEFRDEETLRAILGNHPYYNDFKPFLSQGVDFVFTEEITEEVRVEELEANLERGNQQEETLSKLLAKDVKHGFAVPLCKGAVRSIPGAMVQPCGITSQFTLEPNGSRAVKKRLTHDMSFGMTHTRYR